MKYNSNWIHYEHPIEEIPKIELPGPLYDVSPTTPFIFVGMSILSSMKLRERFVSNHTFDDHAFTIVVDTFSFVVYQLVKSLYKKAYLQ